MVRDASLQATSRFEHAWPIVASTLTDLSGTEQFASYIRGAIAIHAMRRILRLWDEVASEQPPIETMAVKIASRLIRREVFPSIGDDLINRLARTTIAAERVSRQSIGKSVRREVTPSNGHANCFLCGTVLSAKQIDNHASDFFTLEHVWPQSLGGESVADNLLPACTTCQTAKGDAPSWESYNVHNLVMASKPSQSKLEEVSRSRRMRIARHTLHAIDLCEQERLSLKQAFLRIGPMQPVVETQKSNVPLSFFDLRTQAE